MTLPPAGLTYTYSIHEYIIYILYIRNTFPQPAAGADCGKLPLQKKVLPGKLASQQQGMLVIHVL
jgi:hypothetical protein